MTSYKMKCRASDLSSDVVKNDENLQIEYPHNTIGSNVIGFICANQLYDIKLWHRFASQFSFPSDDYNNGWRGEYWGKMMRGASAVLAHTNDLKLYRILKNSVEDILGNEDKWGRISSYSQENEFHGWDVWGRKYVLLGLQYFLEICDDEELNSRIVASMCRQVDYLISKLGYGKRSITDTTAHWLGANSCSVLEPVVRLYNLTHDKKYLDFAGYIVEACEGKHGELNIFVSALENKLKPHEYIETKAYETMSCFEGLAEFYRVTGIEKYKTCVVNFAEQVLANEISIIGTCGCTHELFDNTRLHQVDPAFNGIMQETCVSVTWQKLCEQLFRLTGDTKYIDAIEKTFFNAYLGAMNTHLNVTTEIYDTYEFAQYESKENHVGPEKYQEVLPFDSYSPLRAGTRGRRTGGLQFMNDGSFYGCCACISPMGVATFSSVTLMNSDNCLLLNMYLDGIITTKLSDGSMLKLIINSRYPADNKVRIKVITDSKLEFTIKFRVPAWSKNTFIGLNGEAVSISAGYTALTRKWESGDIISLEFDERIFAIRPPCDSPYRDSYIALRRGCMVLAADARTGIDVDSPISVDIDIDGCVTAKESPECPVTDCLVSLQIPQSNGKNLTLVDYSSAGKTWSEESGYAAWLKLR